MWDWIGKLAEIRSKNIPCALVTVTNTGGATPREMGAKMIVFTSGEFYGTIGGGNLEALAQKEAIQCLEAGHSKNLSVPLGAKTGQCCGGVVELFIEVISNGPTLLLFGGGHVGQALLSVMEGTPFQNALVEGRPEWIEKAQNKKLSKLYSEPTPEKIGETLKGLSQEELQSSYAVIMTHSHDLDYEYLKAVLPFPLAYIGLIGSHPKWNRFKKRLQDDGIPADFINKITCPMGLFKGGKSPKEVAISIAGECLKIYSNKQNELA